MTLKLPKKLPSLRVVNRLLAASIILINLYIFVLPVLPTIQLWWRRNHTKNVAGLPYQTKLDTAPATSNKRAPIPPDNRIVIPRLALNEHIYEGSSPYTVNKGVWALPNSSTPPKRSNTVLVGHRFTYDGPATFYSLDKVGVGDKMVIYWQGKEYDYEVTQSIVVPPTAVEIERPTTDARLTVYTCTPLWSAKNRLVLIAKLIENGASHE